MQKCFNKLGNRSDSESFFRRSKGWISRHFPAAKFVVLADSGKAIGGGLMKAAHGIGGLFH